MVLGPTEGALDKWAHEVGDRGYEWQNFLPYYQRSVQYTPPTVPFTNSTFSQDPKAWSPTGGPLQLSHGAYIDPLATWIQPAVRKLGFEDIAGFSSGKLIGSGYVPYTVNPETQQRSSSEASFLQSVREKSSLHVYPNTLAQKILFDNNKRAIGVRVSANGNTTILHAKKEVILSAGVFQSPQLLMLSGIGPKNKLKPFNIPLQIDLPGVGEGLTDHPLFGTVYRVNVPTASGLLNNPDIAAAIQKAYDGQKAGPLTIPSSGFIAWEKLPSPYRNHLNPAHRRELDKLPDDWPELEHMSLSASAGYQRDYLKEDPDDGFNYASILTSMVAPLSRGSVNLKSANPADLPLVDPNFFAHPGDIAVAIAALRRQREIWHAIDKSIVESEYLPGANFTNDEEIFKFIKESLAPTWHAACSCKMGKKGDKMAVVDNEAKVFGAKGLRVVDASAFPFLIPGHPQGTVYALAEKIADMILKEEKGSGAF